MNPDGYQTLSVRVEDGIARATIDHPPCSPPWSIASGRCRRSRSRSSRAAPAAGGPSSSSAWTCASPRWAGRCSPSRRWRLGIIPGGGGTQRLPQLVGRGRALEVILGCGDVDAETAERWGYVNRALPESELHPRPGRAHRVVPPEAVLHAQAAVTAASPNPVSGLLDEAHRFNQTVALEATRARMEAFLQAGGQSPESELQPLLG